MVLDEIDNNNETIPFIIIKKRNNNENKELLNILSKTIT